MEGSRRFLIALLVCVLALTTSEALKPKTATVSRSARSGSNDISNDISNGNEIEERTLVFPEPYRSLVQTTTRFALAQTRISNVINLDSAMDLINNIGFMMAKPTVLFIVIKAVAVTISTLVAATIFFPGAVKLIEAIWQNPARSLHLDKYMRNGLSEQSVINILTSTTDDALQRVGLDHSCRTKSLCYTGQIVRCSFPNTSEAVSKFASDHFANNAIKDNKYFKAFLSGFSDQNCTSIEETSTPGNCLGNIINSIRTS